MIEQLPIFAQGEALAAIMERIGWLRAEGLYEELTVQQLDVLQVVLWGDQMAGARVQEKCTRRTYRPADEGDHLVEEETFDGTNIYALIYQDLRWKVERIRPVEGAGQ